VKEIVKIYDGDTVTVVIDLGFNTTRLEVLRLAYINAPEIRGDERAQGLISRDYVREKMNNANEIIVNTYKDHKGKYGRYIAEIFVDGINLNKQLVSENLAEYKDYS
jgi:micrococcal nuclease